MLSVNHAFLMAHHVAEEEQCMKPNTAKAVIKQNTCCLCNRRQGYIWSYIVCHKAIGIILSLIKPSLYTATQHTAQHSTAQHSTAQHSTAQHSTAQHSTAQHSTQCFINDNIFCHAKWILLCKTQVASTRSWSSCT